MMKNQRHKPRDECHKLFLKAVKHMKGSSETRISPKKGKTEKRETKKLRVSSSIPRATTSRPAKEKPFEEIIVRSLTPVMLKVH